MLDNREDPKPLISMTTLYLHMSNKIADIMQKRCPEIDHEKIDAMAADVGNFFIEYLERTTKL